MAYSSPQKFQKTAYYQKGDAVMLEFLVGKGGYSELEIAKKLRTYAANAEKRAEQAATINPREQGHTLYSKEQLLAAWESSKHNVNEMCKMLNASKANILRRMARDLCIDARTERQRRKPPTNMLSSAALERMLQAFDGNKSELGRYLGLRPSYAQNIIDYWVSLINNCGLQW